MRNKVKNLPDIVFLHGNVSLYACYTCREGGFDYHFVRGLCCKTCGNKSTRSKLLYPVNNKDYTSDPLVESQWITFENYLKASSLLTIVGYSAPTTDKGEVDKLKSAFKTSPLKLVSVIDIKPEEEIKETWKEFIYVDSYKDIEGQDISEKKEYTFSYHNKLDDSYLFHYIGNSAYAHFAGPIQCEPVEECKYPNDINSLSKLYEFKNKLNTQHNRQRFNS